MTKVIEFFDNTDRCVHYTGSVALTIRFNGKVFYHAFDYIDFNSNGELLFIPKDKSSSLKKVFFNTLHYDQGQWKTTNLKGSPIPSVYTIRLKDDDKLYEALNSYIGPSSLFSTKVYDTVHEVIKELIGLTNNDTRMHFHKETIDGIDVEIILSNFNVEINKDVNFPYHKVLRKPILGNDLFKLDTLYIVGKKISTDRMNAKDSKYLLEVTSDLIKVYKGPIRGCDEDHDELEFVKEYKVNIKLEKTKIKLSGFNEVESVMRLQPASLKTVLTELFTKENVISDFIENETYLRLYVEDIVKCYKNELYSDLKDILYCWNMTGYMYLSKNIYGCKYVMEYNGCSKEDNERYLMDSCIGFGISSTLVPLPEEYQ